MHVVVCLGFPVPDMPCPEFGQYLSYYDPDVAGLSGSIRWTRDINHALVFLTADAALDTIRLQSKTVPLRPDGKPNRPISAYSLEISPLKEALQ